MINKELILNNDFENQKGSILYQDYKRIYGFLELKNDKRFLEKQCYKDCKNNVFSILRIKQLIKNGYPIMIKGN